MAPHQNSSLVKFQGPVQQISQSYQSLPAHLTPHPQDTPKPVQEQQQQEQLKIKQVFHEEAMVRSLFTVFSTKTWSFFLTL